MSKLNCQYSYRDGYLVKGNLGDLLRRLKKGMKLKGRIVDCLGENMYLLRIWGYNILTESEQSFQKFEEIRLIVREIEPHLILDLMHERQTHSYHIIKNRYQTNIIIH